MVSHCTTTIKAIFVAFLFLTASTNSFSQAPAGGGATGGGNTGAAQGRGGTSAGALGRKANEKVIQKAPAPVAGQAQPQAQPAAGQGVPQQQQQQGAAVPNQPNALPVVENPYLQDPQFQNPQQVAVPAVDAVEPEILALRKKIFGYEIFNTPNIVFADPGIVATPRDYTIGPTDQLIMKIWGYSQAQEVLEVSNEGFVFVPRAGNILLAGRTIEQAQKELVQRLSSFYMNLGTVGSGASTYLQLTLGEIRSIRVTVLGQVVAPGTYNISSLSTALNALYLTKGPTENGSFRTIQVMRKNKVAATVDLYELLTKGTLSSDVRLQDNDVIFVKPFEKRVEVKGKVKRIGLFEVLDNEPLSKVLDFTGGFAQDAYTSRVKIIGNTEKEHRVTGIQAKDYNAYLPKNGDEITVEPILDRFENLVVIGGSVYRPGQYSLDEAKTLMQLVKMADGLMGDAFTGRVNITRTREDLSAENISVNLADIINGKASDIELKREDEVYISSKFDLREASTIKVGGEVNYIAKDPAADVQPAPLDIPYSLNMTLEDAIIKAGGFRESAAINQVEVVRRKRDVNIQSVGAQIADVFEFKINKDLTISNQDSKFILEPFDEVIVRKASSYQEQIFVTLEGEVVNPGKYGLISKDEKLSDVIKRAGGLTPQAFVQGATLIRTVKLSEQEIERRQKLVDVIADDAAQGIVQADEVEKNTEDAVGIDLEKILANPGGEEDMLLENADVVRIPKRLETVRLDGDLLFPTTVKYRSSNSFMDYISQAGGFTNTSIRKQAYVIYPNGSVDRTRKFLFVNIYPKVQPGSEIIVPKRQVNNALAAQQTLGTFAAIAQSLTFLVTAILGLASFK